MSSDNNSVLWKVVVHRPDRRTTTEMKSNLTYAEAKAMKEDWEPFFSSEMYYDPVPVLKIKKQSDNDED